MLVFSDTIHVYNYNYNYLYIIIYLCVSYTEYCNIQCRYLYDNQITEIQDNAFVGLESLESLYVDMIDALIDNHYDARCRFLDGNRISSLSRRVFRSLGKLQKL